MSGRIKENPYNEEYYRSRLSKSRVPYERNQKTWMDFFKNIASKIVSTLSPKTVFEFGCAKGFLIENLRDSGIDAEGVDISEYAISQVRDDIKPYCHVGSILEPLPIFKYYDLIICIEVLEHLTEEDGFVAVNNITRYSDTILFSSTPDDFDEPTHLNVKPEEYWIDLFKKSGFEPDKGFNASFMASHAILFRRKNPIKILCLSTGLIASTQIRAVSPLSLLEKHNIIRHRFSLISKKTNIDLSHVHWADIIIFQRIRNKEGFKILKYAQKNRKITVFDIDDNFLEIPEGHPDYGFLNKIKNKRYLKFIKRVNCVTVSTEELYKYLSPYAKKICILPNYIDREICNFNVPKREKREYVTIGYTGNKTHKPDLEIVISAIKKIINEFHNKVQFKFLGYLPSELTEYSQVTYIGHVSDYQSFAHLLNFSNIDLAIAPLKDNLFNRCKSNIKFLEYSACGIPGIYSNIRPYTSTVVDGQTGIIVNSNSSDEWYEAIKLLVENEDLRANIAYNCYQYVRKNYTLQENFKKWSEVYSSLMKDRK